MPAVAATESANPGWSACQGSASSSAIIAAPSAGSETACLPPKLETSITTAMTAARCTLASGPTTITNPPSADAANGARSRRPSPSAEAAQTTAPTRIPQFAPETARRCSRELWRICSSSRSSTSAVSPTAKPGTSSAPGTRSAADRRPERSSDAA